MTANYWTVICPEKSAPGLWRTWLNEKCVAIGWPPSHNQLFGPTAKDNWRRARERALRVKPGDIVIPYLLPYLVGTPGRVTEIKIKDEDWNPTVAQGGYAKKPNQADLGRRINVEWLVDGMPDQAHIAVVPSSLRTAGGESKQTIEFVRPKRRQRILSIIKDTSNWVLYRESDANQTETPPSERAPKNGRALDARFGAEKLYIKRAREAFPILVRQAQARKKIFYSDLAKEMGMRNPRNLNYVLGFIGRSVLALAKKWKTDIPPIQCVAVNKSTGIPGEGIGWFVSDFKDFKKRSREERRQIVEIELIKVFNFSKWGRVLGAFGLQTVKASPSISALKAKAAAQTGVGEREDHRKLKEYVAAHPEILGLSGFSSGKTEFAFPSADRIDVMFNQGRLWVGIEIKGPSSDDADLLRGVFQCVKYLALLEANMKSELQTGNARVILVSARPLPEPVNQLKTILGIEVLEGIKAAGQA